MIVVGGAAGTILGILTFSYFKDIGKINIVISLSYMYILAIIGTMMLVQGVSEIDRARKKIILKKNIMYIINVFRYFNNDHPRCISLCLICNDK